MCYCELKHQLNKMSQYNSVLFISQDCVSLLCLKQTCASAAIFKWSSSQSFSAICHQLHRTCCVTRLKGILCNACCLKASQSPSIPAPPNRLSWLSVCVFGSRRLILLSSGELICWHGNQNANVCERRMHSIEIQIAQAAACNHEQIHSAVLTLLNFETD